MAKVGVALFGLGRIGQIHLPNLVANGDVIVRWLVDVEAAREKAVELCALYKLENTRFAASDKCEEVFSDASTEAVIVGTPTGFHEDLIKKSVKAGKHVFCEKPISFTSETVMSCYDEAKKYGRILFCAFNRRFEPEHARLKEQLRSGELGTPRVVHYNARDPKTPASYISTSGGIFCDSCIHLLDYVTWLLDERPCSVVATGGRTSDAKANYELADDVDSTLITLQFPSGVHAVLEVTRELPINFMYLRLEVVGTKGTHFIHYTSPQTVTTVALDGSEQESKNPSPFMSGYKLEMDCFIRVVQGKEECPVQADGVIQASMLADLCRTSLKEGRVVKL
nr:hypothetical protein BaRGS_031354 [Batillaria attramentaria]